ncbi:MAG: peptide chain release factor N(5)-glutamine methyltransferase [Geobacteraceae bacterium]
MANQQETWTVLKILTWTKEYLAGKGVENARLEAEWLLSAALGLDRVGLYVNFDRALIPAELAVYREMVARRALREPLQYILGTQDFMGLEFNVSKGALIPRHDTEALVEAALQRVAPVDRILDIGVGSGCVAVALAKALPQAEVFGVDKSSEALALAERNAMKHGVGVTLIEGSLFDPFQGRKFNLIVSNPPYIPSADMETLQPEVRDFEPWSALDGGPDGLAFYRHIIPIAPEYLNPDGWLLFEVGIAGASAVQSLFEETGQFAEMFTAKDRNGIERVVGGRLA